MQATDELIRNVVQEVLAHMRNGNGKAATASSNGSQNANGNGKAHNWGVFEDVDPAVSAATAAQRLFEPRGLEGRRKAIACIRKICRYQAESLGHEELEETKI